MANDQHASSGKDVRLPEPSRSVDISKHDITQALAQPSANSYHRRQQHERGDFLSDDNPGDGQTHVQCSTTWTCRSCVTIIVRRSGTRYSCVYAYPNNSPPTTTMTSSPPLVNHIRVYITPSPFSSSLLPPRLPIKTPHRLIHILPALHSQHRHTLPREVRQRQVQPCPLLPRVPPHRPSVYTPRARSMCRAYRCRTLVLSNFRSAKKLIKPRTILFRRCDSTSTF